MTEETKLDAQLESIQVIAKSKMYDGGVVAKELDSAEIQNIEATFAEANDFRGLWEKITYPLDSILAKTTKVIANDPVMDVSKELAEMNKGVQSVYKDIIDNDWMMMKFFKAVPWVGNIANYLDEKWDDMAFNLKDVSGKIDTIFSGFDTAYSSLNKSIDMQKEFLDGLEENLGKIEAYKEYVNTKLEEFRERLETTVEGPEREKYKMFVSNVDFFMKNLATLLWNLELARKRLLIRLDAAIKLVLAMNSSRPIFKTLLSTAIIEISSQKAIDASLKSIEVMWDTIDNMSTELTDRAIDSSKKTEEMTSNPILDTKVFVANVEKLKEHFDTIDTYRETVKLEAEEQQKIFDVAVEDIKKMKEVKMEDYKELGDALQND